MAERRTDRQTKFKGITTICGIVVMLLLLSVSCGSDNKEVVAVEFNPEITYTMRTTDIVSLISDSGTTRYRVTSPEMLMFDKAAEPYWYFPQGVYFERFDSLFATDLSVKADTAYNWYNRKLCKLIGNVDVVNLEGDRFETDTLYWDSEAERVYSEAFMRITKKDQVLTGIGFESNQNMTKFRIKRPQGSMPVTEEETSDTTAVEKTQEEMTPVPVILPPIQRERPRRRVLTETVEKDSIEGLIKEAPPETK
jgi:LPS export ABC transporter protein LptC